MMRTKHYIWMSFLAAAELCVASAPVLARPVFLNVFVTKYEAYSSAISERSCANCHVSTTDFKLNLYGKQIAQALIESGDKKLTPEILEKVEKLDANGDGVSNLDELKAGKAPGELKAAAAVTPPIQAAKLTPKADEHKRENGEKSERHSEHHRADSKASSAGGVKSSPSNAKTVAQNTAPTRVASAAVKHAAAKIETSASTGPVAETGKANTSNPEPPKSEASKPSAAEAAKSPVSHEPESKPILPANRYHPAIVHFPIALFIGGLLFDLLGTITKRDGLLFAGWYNLVLAAISSVVGVISGFAAMIAMKLPFTGLIPQHMLFAVMGAFIMWMMVSLRVHRHKEMGKPVRLLYFLLAVAGLALISYSGHLGGLYVYGE